ncbi:hypothetical protein LCGC14_0930470 [marine sediment metagenome]|uniref:Uncharacterized protein n=1 Tax=marine sediment metagenome TaxID=412755 RepID=A0A0F9R6L3_9ZZZZ
MKEKEILKNNKLIAEFMGLTILEGDYNKLHCIPGKGGFVILVKVEGDYIPVYLLQYDSSWDWLMPVVDKIELLSPSRRTFTHVDMMEEFSWEVSLGGNGIYISKVSKIDAMYNGVVKFIKWYNKKKK